jgi:hypothetical protein
MTLNIPEELATRLDAFEDKLPQILEVGLRELNATAFAANPELMVARRYSAETR